MLAISCLICSVLGLDGLLLPGFKPIELGGWGEGIVTNTKWSTHVHILNILDTAMLFWKSDRDMFSLSQIWPHLPRIKQFIIRRMSTDFCCCCLSELQLRHALSAQWQCRLERAGYTPCCCMMRQQNSMCCFILSMWSAYLRGSTSGHLFTQSSLV